MIIGDPWFRCIRAILLWNAKQKKTITYPKIKAQSFLNSSRIYVKTKTKHCMNLLHSKTKNEPLMILPTSFCSNMIRLYNLWNCSKSKRSCFAPTSCKRRTKSILMTAYYRRHQIHFLYKGIPLLPIGVVAVEGSTTADLGREVGCTLYWSPVTHGQCWG